MSGTGSLMTTLEESFRLALLGMETGETVVIGGIGEIDVGGGHRRHGVSSVVVSSSSLFGRGSQAAWLFGRLHESRTAVVPFPRAATRVARKGIISVCASTG